MTTVERFVDKAEEAFVVAIIDHLKEAKKKLTPGAKDSKHECAYSHSGTQL